MPGNHSELEKRLWDAADKLRANSNLNANQYSTPVLGLLFLRYADARFSKAKAKLEGGTPGGRRTPGAADYQAQGIMFVPEKASFARLLALPEGEDIGKELNEAMQAIEEVNEPLRGVLPRSYTAMSSDVLWELLKLFNSIPVDEAEGDTFGKIYEYFLGKFAGSEGQRGGEFFTPTSIVRLIVEIIEPKRGLLLDPACGSGGMFVQSADFVQRHKGKNTELTVYGQEKVEQTVRLARMNLAMHGLEGEIKSGNSYYEDLYNSPGRFDYVMANPPFNVNGVDKEKLKDDRARFPFGMPKPDNANYLWIQQFYSALNSTGRAGFVMANSASDARQSELEIRKQLIQSGAVDVMVAVGSNFFYNVTLPVTLWFLDKNKAGNNTVGTVLFIDARSIFTQVDRAHREFSDAQIGLIATLSRLYRGEDLNGFVFNREEHTALPDTQLKILEAAIAGKTFTDIPGLCKTATLADLEAQGWSLNPGRYVGVAGKDAEDFDFLELFEELNEELEILNIEAHELEMKISENAAKLIS